MKEYFSHDAEARNDEKLIKMRMAHGWEGYGIFWAIVEKLRGSADYMCIKDYNMIAFDLRVESGLVKSIVESFGLFEFTTNERGECFYSESLRRRMTAMDERRERLSAAGRLGNEKRWRGGEQKKLPLSPPDCHPIANKINNIKDIPPTPLKGERERRLTVVEKKLIRGFDCQFVDDDYLSIVIDWVEYKTARREAYASAKSLHTMYAKLRALSGNNPSIARQIIDESMANNWAGIFALKQNNNNHGQQNKPRAHDAANYTPPPAE